jgi:hypothetical protein
MLGDVIVGPVAAAATTILAITATRYRRLYMSFRGIHPEELDPHEDTEAFPRRNSWYKRDDAGAVIIKPGNPGIDRVLVQQYEPPNKVTEAYEVFDAAHASNREQGERNAATYNFPTPHHVAKPVRLGILVGDKYTADPKGVLSPLPPSLIDGEFLAKGYVPGDLPIIPWANWDGKQWIGYKYADVNNVELPDQSTLPADVYVVSAVVGNETGASVTVSLKLKELGLKPIKMVRQ